MSDSRGPGPLSSLNSEPFFHVKKVGEHFELTGQAFCFLGHEVKVPGSAPDEGVFARWHWDGHALRVKTDRYGFYPLYYFVREGECAVSPSIPRLISLGAPTEWDYAGLAVFFRIGFFLGEDTPFKAIRAFPTLATFLWDGHKLKISGELPIGKPHRLSRTAIIDGYVELFRSAVRRRLPSDENFALTLSGGRDSRHILLELCEAGHKPKVCLTVGSYLYLKNEELESASSLAHALNVNHVVLSQTGSLFSLECRKNEKTNFCADEHEWILTAADYLQGQVQTVYDGLGGSLFCDGFGLTTERQAICNSGRMDHLAIDLLADESALRVFKASALKHISRELALQRLQTELLKHAEAPNPISSFYFWNRTRREVALSPYRIFNQYKTVFSPFTDQILTDFLSSIPASMVLDHTLHNDTIARAFPKVANIPYAKKPGTRKGAFKEFRHFAIDVAKFGLRRRGSSWLSYSYLLPRLGRCLIDPAYSSSILWLGPITTYMLQLEAVQANIKELLQPDE